MLNDSDIIHYATWSLENGSKVLSKSKAYKSPADAKKISSSQNKQTKKAALSSNARFSITSSLSSSSNSNEKNSTRQKKTFCSFLKREIKTFCCFVYFLTRFKFHSIKCYLILLCLMTLFTQMIQGGFISAIISSLQNHFNLSTSKIGYILSSFDISSVVVTPIISYFGSRYNKAKIIGICSFSYVIGCVVFCVPYFFGPYYTITNGANNRNSMTSPEVCLNNMFYYGDNGLNFSTTSTQSTSTESQATTKNPDDVSNCQRDQLNAWTFYVLIAGQVLMSIGVGPLFSLGTTYLCDNLEERQHAFYTGIFYGSYALGPAIGYLSASYFLSKWVYFYKESPPHNITDIDPRWVGCWYLGFLISGVCIFLISIVLLSFPEALIKTKITLKEKRRMKKQKSLELLKALREENGSIFSGTSSNNGRLSSLSINNEVAFDFNGQRQRRLETIDEVSEIVDKNFEFLDSISAKIDCNNNSPTTATTATSSSSNGNANLMSSTMPNDSVSAKFLNSTSSSKSNASSVKFSETSSTAIVPSQTVKYTCAQSIYHQLIIFRLKIKGFIKGLLKLVLNIRYSLLVLVISIDCLLLSAFSNYMILYSQNVYQMSSAKSSILVGGVIVPSAIFGTILGGFIVKKFRLGIEGCTRFIMICSTCVLAGIFGLIFIRCDGKATVGVGTINNGFNATAINCNKFCNCDSFYFPVCGIDLETYVSPCYIGCSNALTNGGYSNCSCLFSANTMNKTVMATQGACPRNCSSTMVFFLIVLFAVVAVESLCLTPATMLILKIIDKPLQSFSLGLMRCVNTLIAYIPAPIVFSQVIDNTCILWNSKCIGDKGTCLEYDVQKFHYVLFGASAGIKIASCCTLIFFTFFIHKSYIRKRHYTNKVVLNHEATSVLTSKQKYKIDSEIASMDPSEDTDDKQNKAKSSKKIKKPSTVVLQRQISYADEFTSLDRSATPDFFNNNNNDNVIKILDALNTNDTNDQSNERLEQNLNDNLNDQTNEVKLK